MATYKTKVFARLARKAGVTDAMLQQARQDADAGLIDADLGGGLIKQRVARTGKGKSGGYRAILAFRENHRTVFIDVFAKSDWSNIGDAELADFKTIGKAWLKATDRDIANALKSAILIEVSNDEADEDQSGSAVPGGDP